MSLSAHILRPRDYFHLLNLVVRRSDSVLFDCLFCFPSMNQFIDSNRPGKSPGFIPRPFIDVSGAKAQHVAA